MTALRDAALGYAARLGWPVHPLRAGTKRPATQHGFHDASVDPEKIRAWWRRWPNANIGSPLLPDLTVVDEDEWGALRAVVANLGPLPTTATQLTRSDGAHLIYRLTEGRRLHHGFPLVEGATPDKPAVEVLQGGKGYILLPPSRVDPGEYRWTSDPRHDPITEAPEWLYEVAGERRGRNPAEWSALAGKTIPEGARNTTLASVAGLLFRLLPSATLAYELAMLWAQHQCIPSIPEAEARRTLASIAGLEARRRGGAA